MHLSAAACDGALKGGKDSRGRNERHHSMEATTSFNNLDGTLVNASITQRH